MMASLMLPWFTYAQANPLPEDLPSYGEQLVRMLITLGVILVVLLVVGKVLQRWMGRPKVEDKGDALDVLAVRRVDGRTKVVLLRAGAEHVLIAVTDSGAVRLASGPSLDPDFPRASSGLHDGALAGAPRAFDEGATGGSQ